MLLWFQNKLKIQLEEYLFFDDTSPSAHLEEFACEEVMGQKVLPPWGRGLNTVSVSLSPFNQSLYLCLLLNQSLHICLILNMLSKRSLPKSYYITSSYVSLSTSVLFLILYLPPSLSPRSPTRIISVHGSGCIIYSYWSATTLYKYPISHPWISWWRTVGSSPQNKSSVFRRIPHGQIRM